jgi:hypothetical protein
MKKQSQVYADHDPVGDTPEEILKEIYGPSMKRVPDCDNEPPAEGEITNNSIDSD